VPDRPFITIDANEAVASVAHRTHDLCVIYPITPSSPMGEHADAWSASGRRNIWGEIPDVAQMQSEGGAAGACHGALTTGALTTTFTASQGLLLMLPNMYKIAGELTPFCMHVAARTVATHALSIFGDHSDVYACRQTGFGMLAAASVQEAQDLALIAQAASLESRIPFMHFFDGFRTSHEVQKIRPLSDADLAAVLDAEAIAAHRARGLDSESPQIRGTAQNPDTFFQAREACEPFYRACPAIVQAVMDRFAGQVGRRYHLLAYHGPEDAESVIVLMGSGAQTAAETARHLAAEGEKCGVLQVRLYRPFPAAAFLAALPATTRRIAVLDRAKECGSTGEPLYLDVLTTLLEAEADGSLPCAERPRVVGGRYGLSSKEFTPAMVKAVYESLAAAHPKNHFTVGINDDVSGSSLPFDPDWVIEPASITRCLFHGLGADGTVGANKNSIKIIGEETELHAQGYFVYDSKKSGARTVSHLRFGPDPIRAPYQVSAADFLACHQWSFLQRYDILGGAAEGATVLLNAPFPPEQVFDRLPRPVQEALLEKGCRLFAIDAYAVANATGMGRRINTVMQTCFFALSGILPREEAIAHIKEAIRKTYSKKGEAIVQRNYDAVDGTLEHLHAIALPEAPTATGERAPEVPEAAPELVRRVSALMMAGEGDRLPVSALPVDGTWPTGTTRWEKRNIAETIPIWDEAICIQCNKCALVCPHAAIRPKVYDPGALEGAPAAFPTADYKAPDFRGSRYTLQVAPEDCTGCGLCVAVCPARDKQEPRRKAINMAPQREHVDRERAHFDFFLALPEVDRPRVHRLDVKGSQFFQPLFEFSGACAGCGETPYIKLLTQLFGDRALIANATGCSSIYGGNLPTTPYCTDAAGRGPAWSNSLFEDNAEFGYGMRLALDTRAAAARALLAQLASGIGFELADALAADPPEGEAGLQARREQVAALKARLASLPHPEARRLEALADHLLPRSVWLVGGDGWAYDIGYGGLDHVLAGDRNVNVLVLDTEVYSNTGGQASKATPLGAAAKFAAGGKGTGKKDLGLAAMSYGHVYVASVAMGAKDNHVVEVFRESESYPGPSLIIAYSHCIAHGYDMVHGLEQQQRAVDSGIWPLYRFDPRRTAEGQPPLKLDTRAGKTPVSEYMRHEARFNIVQKIDPERFRRLAAEADEHARRRVSLYQQLATVTRHAETESAASP